MGFSTKNYKKNPKNTTPPPKKNDKFSSSANSLDKSNVNVYRTDTIISMET